MTLLILSSLLGKGKVPFLPHGSTIVFQIERGFTIVLVYFVHNLALRDAFYTETCTQKFAWALSRNEKVSNKTVNNSETIIWLTSLDSLNNRCFCQVHQNKQIF